MFADLSGKVTLVTGAGQGIGRAIAEVFAAAGAKVMIATRTESHGVATVERIGKAGGDARLCAVDIGTEENVRRAVDEALKAWGALDIVVHNAASFLGGPIEHYSEQDLETVLAVNLKTCYRLAAASIPEFRKRGGGRLLFTSSVTGPRVAMPSTSYYAASKAAINAFIRTAALELARDNVTVNGVEPGFIHTAAMDLLADAEGQERMTRYIPAGRMGAPEDVAHAMLYLASDEAAYVTGQTICVDGGSTLPESPVFLEELEGIKELAGTS